MKLLTCFLPNKFGLHEVKRSNGNLHTVNPVAQRIMLVFHQRTHIFFLSVSLFGCFIESDGTHIP